MRGGVPLPPTTIHPPPLSLSLSTRATNFGVFRQRLRVPTCACARSLLDTVVMACSARLVDWAAGPVFFFGWLGA